MQLDIPAGDFAGYIFDLDGTLIDSMPLHYQAWQQALRESGFAGELEEDFFYSLGGVPTRQVVERMSERYRLKLDADAVFERKEALFTALMPQVRRIEAVVAFAERMSRERPLAVASGGPRPVVAASLRQAGLTRLFPVVVTPEDVRRGKPAPDMFLLAAERMGVAPGKCLVFEDADPGIAAAMAAGMAWVRVPSRARRAA